MSTDDPKGVLIVANPYSGSGDNHGKVDRLRSALERHGRSAEVCWDLEQWAEAMRTRRAAVVAAGGDGTLREALRRRPTAPVAMLPLGVENLFAQYFGHPASPEALADLVAAGHARWVDLAWAGDRPFTLMLSVGFDAAVVQRLHTWRQQATGVRRIRRWHYTGPILRSFLGEPSAQIELDADGARHEGAHAFIFNIPKYGLGFDFLRDVPDDDGEVDWILFQRPGRWPLLRYAWALRRGRHLDRPDVQTGRAKHVRIRSDPTTAVQTDGDFAGGTPVDVRAEPSALRVLVPAEG